MSPAESLLLIPPPSGGCGMLYLGQHLLPQLCSGQSRCCCAAIGLLLLFYRPPPNRSSNGSVRLSRSPRPSSSSCWVWFPSPACMPVVMLPVVVSIAVSVVSAVVWSSSSSPAVFALLSPDVVVLSLKPSSPIVKLRPSVKFDAP